MNSKRRSLLMGLMAITVVSTTTPLMAMDTFTTSSGTQVKPEQQFKANVFWTSFRESVQREDWSAVARMCSNPLVVRGTLDDDPIKRITGRNLPKVLQQQMNKPLFLGTGKMSRTPAALIREMPVLTAENWLVSDQIRFHNMLFLKNRDGWKLVTIYDEE